MIDRFKTLYPMNAPLNQFFDEVEYPATDEFVEYLLERCKQAEDHRDEWRSKFENEYRKHQETYCALVTLRSLRKLQTP